MYGDCPNCGSRCVRGTFPVLPVWVFFECGTEKCDNATKDKPGTLLLSKECKARKNRKEEQENGGDITTG